MSAHKVKAEELLMDALAARTGSDIESSRQVQALVHATLELAEQQRIANLLQAIGRNLEDYDTGEWMSAPLHASVERQNSAKAEIREWLGI